MHKLIFILGIDALDYDLVEKLNLNNLKQLEYGKVIVPINEKIGIPHSPEVWASFLVGERMSMNFISSSYYINLMLRVLGFFHISTNNIFITKALNLLKKLNIRSNISFGNLNKDTFLDIIKSKEINVPYYSFDHLTFNISTLFGVSKISLKQAIIEIKSIYEMRKKQIIREIKDIENYDVVFAFMHTTDLLQHLSLSIDDIEKHYIDLDNYVSRLKLELENSFECFTFILVSDHGFDFDKETHSMNGFYSSSTHLIPIPEKITDFYGIILELVNKCNDQSISYRRDGHI